MGATVASSWCTSTWRHSARIRSTSARSSRTGLRSPPRPRVDSAAMPPSVGSSSAMDGRSRWVVELARSRPRYAGRSERGTTGAGFPAVCIGGSCTPITLSTGLVEVRQIWATWSSCAPITTGSSTKAAFRYSRAAGEGSGSAGRTGRSSRRPPLVGGCGARPSRSATGARGSRWTRTPSSHFRWATRSTTGLRWRDCWLGRLPVPDLAGAER